MNIIFFKVFFRNYFFIQLFIEYAAAVDICEVSCKIKANRTGHTRESNVDKVGIFVWSAPNSVTRTKKQFLTDVATTSSVTCSRYDVKNGHCCRCTPRTLGWISGKVGLVTVADYRRLNVHHLTSKTSIESEVLTDWIRSSTTTEQ